jgi:hypothetical protein
MQTNAQEWLSIPRAFPLLSEFFNTQATFRYHLNKRHTNGLSDADAVRLSPLGRLLVNPARVKAWAIGEKT